MSPEASCRHHSNKYVTILKDFGIDVPVALLNKYYDIEKKYMDTQYNVSYKMLMLKLFLIINTMYI